MRYNVHVASVFKNHHNTLEMVGALFDENGQRRSRDEFVREARKINDQYYKGWLRTEFNTGEQMGLWGSRWAGFEERGGFLVYRTQGDGKVRPEHSLLDGARYPVNHRFWGRYYTSNGWNCRCFVRWDGYDGEEKAPEGLPELGPLFDGNVGQTGQVFNENHPYFTVDGRYQERANDLFGYRPPVDPGRFLANLETFELLKDDPNHRLAFVDNLSGGFVFRHTLHPEREFIDHIAPARRLATDGDSVVLRPVVEGVKNPDALVNGQLTDFKRILDGSNIRNTMNQKFRNARAQDLTSVIISIGAAHAVEDVIDGVRRAFFNDRRKQIQNMKLIIDDTILIEITRAQYEDGRYRDIIKKMARTR